MTTLKIDADVLQNTLEANIKEENVDDERLQRIELRKKQLHDKLEEMIQKYFDKSDDRSIPNAILKHANLGNTSVYINLDRNDFTSWHTFIKGGYKNAHPRKCVHMFLRYAVQNEYLPKHIRWNIWNNSAFTVVFHIKNNRYDKETQSEQEQIPEL